MSTEPTDSQAPAQDLRTFNDHINELRRRVTYVALLFIVASSLAYTYRDIVIHVVLSPLGDQKLIYLTPAGGFAFIFQITMYVGAVVAAPLLIYHLYKFVRPALPKRAQRYSLRVILISCLLMLSGVSFGYFVAVPAALHFLTTFAGDFVTPNLTADSYLNFIMAYVAGLGILFQLPLLVVFWNWMTPLSPKKLLNTERYIILAAYILAAMITPTPDVVNQSLVAVPIILIYQLGVIAVIIINRRERKFGKVDISRHVSKAQLVPKPVVTKLVDAKQAAMATRTPTQPKSVPQQPVVTTRQHPITHSVAKVRMSGVDGFSRTGCQSLARPRRNLALDSKRSSRPGSVGNRGVSSLRPHLSIDGVRQLN